MRHQNPSDFESAGWYDEHEARYQWFVTQKPGHYSIIEEYVDADAAETHNNHVDSLLRELFAVAELVSVSFYGELNRYLREWISGREASAVNKPL